MSKRGEGAAAIVFGLVIGAGGYLLGNVIQFGGVTFAAFNFGVLIGAVMIVMGLVAVVRGR